MQLRCDLGKPLKHALNHDGCVQIIDITISRGFVGWSLKHAKTEAVAIAVDAIELELELIDESNFIAFLVPESVTQNFGSTGKL